MVPPGQKSQSVTDHGQFRTSYSNFSAPRGQSAILHTFFTSPRDENTHNAGYNLNQQVISVNHFLRHFLLTIHVNIADFECKVTKIMNVVPIENFPFILRSQGEGYTEIRGLVIGYPLQNFLTSRGFNNYLTERPEPTQEPAFTLHRQGASLTLVIKLWSTPINESLNTS
jgi:hypothetical protein